MKIKVTPTNGKNNAPYFMVDTKESKDMSKALSEALRTAPRSRLLDFNNWMYICEKV